MLGPPAAGGPAAAQQQELAELRAYCARLEEVVTHDGTASALLHDTRSLLTALGVLLARDGNVQDELGQAARHAAELARQMAALRKTPPTGKPPRCEPNEILVRLQRVLEVLVPGSLVLELGEEVGAARVAQVPFQRVVLNLVGNAGEAAGPAGEVRVRTERRGDVVILRVMDSGAGIPSEVRERLLDPTFTTKAQGTGLGLALVARTVSEAGGVLEVRSPPDGGTVARVELPGA